MKGEAKIIHIQRLSKVMEANTSLNMVAMETYPLSERLTSFQILLHVVVYLRQSFMAAPEESGATKNKPRQKKKTKSEEKDRTLR